jgi:hypothetical protein
MERPVAATPGRVCGLYVSISNPRLLFDLQFFLWRVGCATTQVDSHELEVQVPGAPSDEQALREVELYLELWRGRKSFSDVEVSVVGDALERRPL